MAKTTIEQIKEICEKSLTWVVDGSKKYRAGFYVSKKEFFEKY
jgi:hypothetical protein